MIIRDGENKSNEKGCVKRMMVIVNGEKIDSEMR